MRSPDSARDDKWRSRREKSGGVGKLGERVFFIDTPGAPVRLPSMDPIDAFTPARVPTMYFIGVTTEKSSINRVFPRWAEVLGLGECRLVGIDFKLHDEPARYREAVSFIKRDPLSLGALVTTHKMDLYDACQDLFDEIEPMAALMWETSSLSKTSDGTRFVAGTSDPVAGGLALKSFLPEGHWMRTGAEAFVLGAGGSSLAVTWTMMQPSRGADRPSKIIVANRSPGRLIMMKKIHREMGVEVPMEYHLTPRPPLSDAICSRLRPASLVINATGLGKDAPGSPLTESALFPQDGFVWEFNYRGDLVFLEQARAQARARRLHIADGWTYFLHGWTRVIADVFHVEVPTAGPVFEELARIAASVRHGCSG